MRRILLWGALDADVAVVIAEVLMLRQAWYARFLLTTGCCFLPSLNMRQFLGPCL